MTDLKLEVGKWYLKRNGVITKIESKTSNSEYPFHCFEGYAYSPTGKSFKGYDRSEEIVDLAKEITEPNYEIITHKPEKIDIEKIIDKLINSLDYKWDSIHFVLVNHSGVISDCNDYIELLNDVIEKIKEIKILAEGYYNGK